MQPPANVSNAVPTIPLAIHRTLTKETVRLSACPACGDHLAIPFLDEQTQPLATLAWPKSQSEAQRMKRLPLAFVRCTSCGHVYNQKFQYEEVPYSLQPNLMFNRGAIWSKHISSVRDLLIRYLPKHAVVVEIGCGSGDLLQAFAVGNDRGDCKYIGFDPSVKSGMVGPVEFRGELFIPDHHLAELRPDMLISRHVLEHMLNPLGFLQSISMAAEVSQIQTRLYTEVPCIDRVFAYGRVEDFYYEHNSHFTTRSFTRMLQRADAELEMLAHNYNQEVLSAIVQFGGHHTISHLSGETQSFRERARLAQDTVSKQLEGLFRSGTTVAIWGGTGKGAAFMNYFQVDSDRFPHVVDSDPDKVGTYVPGTGQQIVSPNRLNQIEPQVVIIPTQWRAVDIVIEMESMGIEIPEVWIEHAGQLIDYRSGKHPY